MKDLNRNEVYDLRGVTHEQAEELLQWLIKKETRWVNNGILDITQCKYLVFYINRWCVSNEKEPTTHISTLFEPSYEEQLIEAVKRVEELKRKINEPKVGDWMFLKDCGFRNVKHVSHGASLQGSGWQKVTDPFTLETLNNYNK